MKKHRLGGLLLGVSVALLLAGGVALAASVFVTANKECVPCWPGARFPTDDAYIVELTIGGWDHAHDWYCERDRIDGELFFKDCYTLPPEDPYTLKMAFPCEWGQARQQSVLGHEVIAADGLPGPLGEHNYRVWQPDTGEADQVSFTVAEVCEVEEAVEFVPEPATILLFGSGLAGLAGYATLRWRTRE